MQKTLSEIILEAANDDTFREALLSDHQSALSSKGYELSSGDMQLLNDAITKGAISISTSDLLAAFSEIATGSTFPIPPSWEPRLDEPQT